MNKWFCIVAGLMLSGLAMVSGPSCKSSRKVIAQPIKEQGPEYLFEQLKKNELKYNSLSLRFNAEAELDNDSKSFSGAVNIIRDSVIWLSISKFGLEAARFLITQDSAKMINRINNTYFVGDFGYVCEIFKIDFDYDMLQALIVGNDFSYYDNDVFKASIDNKEYKLSTVGRRKLKKYVKRENEAQRVLIQDIWLDPETFKIVKISMKEVKQENRRFDSFYSGFEMIDDQRFPFNLRVEINDEKKIAVDITFTKATLNSVENIPFKIPEGYTKVEK
jgi:hypothetical protein